MMFPVAHNFRARFTGPELRYCALLCGAAQIHLAMHINVKNTDWRAFRYPNAINGV
jgi:hypothetical protein